MFRLSGTDRLTMWKSVKSVVQPMPPRRPWPVSMAKQMYTFPSNTVSRGSYTRQTSGKSTCSLVKKGLGETSQRMPSPLKASPKLQPPKRAPLM